MGENRAGLVARLRDSKYRPTLFTPGDHVPAMASSLDSKWTVVAQREVSMSDRLRAAFADLLRNPGDRAVLVDSYCQDLPLVQLKRAFQRLKHRDVVVGPAFDGGIYLLGLHAPVPALLAAAEWGTSTMFEHVLTAVEHENMTLSVLSPWYVADDPSSRRLYELLERARRMGHAQSPRSAAPKE